MNIAIILAGGTGSRVGADVPKQFIEVEGKPVLAYTLDIFQHLDSIDAIEVVCHKDWVDEVDGIIDAYGIDKAKWVTVGGDTFQDSTANGVLNLKGKIADDDIVVISFGVSPMTPVEDIEDSIHVCSERGNAIAAKDIDLCTCVKDDELGTTQNLIRETIKGFANPWAFKYRELLDAYETAIEKGTLDDLEPHTTSLFLALGKRLWFSQSTSMSVKITTPADLDLFEGYLLLKRKRETEANSQNTQITRKS